MLQQVNGRTMSPTRKIRVVHGVTQKVDGKTWMTFINPYICVGRMHTETAAEPVLGSDMSLSQGTEQGIFSPSRP